MPGWILALEGFIVPRRRIVRKLIALPLDVTDPLQEGRRPHDRADAPVGLELGAKAVKSAQDGGVVTAMLRWALERGVIDASDWGTLSMNQDLGYHKLARHPSYPGFHSMPIGDFTVRQQEWDKLPDDIKQILTALCREWAWDTIERVAAEDAKLVSEAKSKGYTPIAWTPEEKAKARKLAQEIWQGWKGKNEQTKRAIEMQEAWLRELGRIQ